MESPQPKKKLKHNSSTGDRVKLCDMGLGGDVSSPVQKQKGVAEIALISYTPDELGMLADGFSKEMLVAKCPFGEVYHGMVPNKAQEVTVVVLGNELERADEVVEYFEGMKLLSHSIIMNHSGFAQPIGFCNGPSMWGIVFDFPSSSTLKDKLFDVTFTWSQRMMVAVRLAESLQYLHELEPSFTIRTVDKSQIIIDEDFNPRLITFGKRSNEDFFKKPNPLYLTRYGYIAPDIGWTGSWSTKCDVFSYGIILLELMSMSPVIDHSLGDKRYIMRRVPPRSQNGKLESAFVHEKLQHTDSYHEEDGVAVTELALLCAAWEKEDRPDMVDIVASLKSLEVIKDSPRLTP
uniref:Protein kinase APK1B, chloroplastic n=3 Tax=Anthurium amnicola TaxID=1678845 RepID=A0A1D1Z8J5_9ARAE